MHRHIIIVTTFFQLNITLKIGFRSLSFENIYFIIRCTFYTQFYIKKSVKVKRKAMISILYQSNPKSHLQNQKWRTKNKNKKKTKTKNKKKTNTL